MRYKKVIFASFALLALTPMANANADKVKKVSNEAQLKTEKVQVDKYTSSSAQLAVKLRDLDKRIISTENTIKAKNLNIKSASKGDDSKNVADADDLSKKGVKLTKKLKAKRLMLLSEKAKTQKQLKEATVNRKKSEAKVKVLNTKIKADKLKKEQEAKAKAERDKTIVGQATNYLGVPYVYGGTTPSGFDCSGFVQYVFAKTGISLPRTSQAQSTVGEYVSVNNLQAGDMVFWGGVGSAYHVGIYVGDGMYIHAPIPGQTVSYEGVGQFTPSFGRRISQ